MFFWFGLRLWFMMIWIDDFIFEHFTIWNDFSNVEFHIIEMFSLFHSLRKVRIIICLYFELLLPKVYKLKTYANFISFIINSCFQQWERNSLNNSFKPTNNLKFIKSLKPTGLMMFLSNPLPPIKKIGPLYLIILIQDAVVYIGHLPHGFFEEQMKEYFTQYGEVLGVKLARARKTAKSKGYAFIQFKYPEVA